MNNLEAVARHIVGKIVILEASPEKRANDVDRFWCFAAAQLEAGLIDDTGKDVRAYTSDESFAAFKDWKSRQPDGFEVPARIPGL